MKEPRKNLPGNTSLQAKFEQLQIELETKMEELKEANDKVAIAASFFDFAPSANFILDHNANIVQLNLSGASMFRKDRSELVNSNFRQYVENETLTEFNDFFIKVFKTNSKQACEIELSINKTHFKYLHIEGIVSKYKKECLITAFDITGCKTAEIELNNRMQLFQGLFNVSPDAVILIDPHHPTISWSIVDCNIAACLMNGYSREEMIGHSIDLLNETEGTTEERIAYFEELQNKGTIRKEIEHRHKDGHLFTIEVLTSIVTLGGKEMVLGIDRDITERKLAEEDTREAEDRFRMVFENVFDGICIYNEDPDPFKRKLIECNERYATNSGFSRKELLSRGHTQDLQITHENLANEIRLESLSEKKAYRGSYSWIRPDGKDNIIEYIGVPIIWRGKSYSIGIDRDITFRKRAEEALRESNEFNNSLLKAIPFGMDIVDEHGSILFMSEKLVQLFGSKAIGQKCWDQYSDEKIQCINCPLISGINIGKTEIYETNRVFEGKTFQISHTGMLFQGKKAILEIFQDITERKFIETELIAAKERAEESDRLKSTFLANMSHEIRTPLNSIIGFSELMADPDYDHAQQFRFARMINESGNHLLSIISDIMDISKIEARQIIISKRAFSVNKLIANIQKEFTFKAIEKGIELRLDRSNPKEEVVLESDETKITQILVNFVGNSIKFTNEGLIVIGFKTTDDFIQFHVKDTGIGISKEFHDQIFERFQQVEAAYSRKYGGNGLGLAISKGLVELMGGTIWMESEQGMGSTFYFTVPKS